VEGVAGPAGAEADIRPSVDDVGEEVAVSGASRDILSARQAVEMEKKGIHGREDSGSGCLSTTYTKVDF
jgi:hypothetical protein